jgi:flagellar motor switch protein FliN/FliY
MTSKGDTAGLQAIRVFLDGLKEELMQEISAAAAVGTTITRSEPAAKSDPLPDGLIWWTGSRGGELDGTLFVGGKAEAWKAFGFGGESGDPAEDAAARFRRCLDKTFERRLGPSTIEGTFGWGEAPESFSATLVLSILSEDSAPSELHCCFSPALQDALRRDQTSHRAQSSMDPGTPKSPPIATSPVALDLFMDIEVPVRVSFGRTRVRMGELLSMSVGGVIELDQDLGEYVDVLVNDCVVARGEVVAIDGNYGVRIIETTPVGRRLPGRS